MVIYMLNFYIAGEFLYTIPHRTCDRKNEVRFGYGFGKTIHRTCNRKNEVQYIYDFG